jgi:hypothetical protein
MASSNFMPSARCRLPAAGRKDRMAKMAMVLVVLGIGGLNVAVSFAQTTPVAMAGEVSDGKPSPGPMASFWDVVIAEADRPISMRFVEPALAERLPSVQLPTDSMSIAAPLPLFQPGRWIDQQTAGDTDDENPLRHDRAIEPQFVATGFGRQVIQVARLETAELTPPISPGQEVIPVPPSAEELLGAPITTLTTDIRVRENPRLNGDFPTEAPASLSRRVEMSYVMHRPGTVRLCYTWDAPLTGNNPLYFEETNLERHGYSPRFLRAVQPVVSAAEFFATVPTLPYQIVAMPPCECIYTLGEYRPGSCVPYQINYPPWSTAGGVVEAGTAVGLAFLIP